MPAASLTPELLASLLTSGDDELAAWTLRHALREASRAVVYDGLLKDAMRLVGERSATGRWSVADEHLASRTLMRALEQVRPKLGPESRVGPVAVLAGAAGEQHMIGLVCLEQTLQEHGWTTANLGAESRPKTSPATSPKRRRAGRAVRVGPGTPGRPRCRHRRRARRRPGTRVRVLLGGRITEHGGPAIDPAPDWAGTSLVEATAYATSIGNGGG